MFKLTFIAVSWLSEQSSIDNAVKPSTPVKSAILFAETSKFVTPLMFAVGTKSSKGPTS